MCSKVVDAVNIMKSSCRDGAREEMLGGAKTVRVPTASEASKIFTGHTYQIGLNSTTISKSITSKLRECRQCTEIFKNSSADGGAQ